MHKTTEGGDWFDPSYGPRRSQAEAAGLLWGGYHFGTRQYSGEKQASAFLSAAQPGPNDRSGARPRAQRHQARATP